MARQVFRQSYDFKIKTRQIRLSQYYSETEFKQARVFLAGITTETGLVLKSEARISGQETADFVEFRFGQTEPYAKGNSGELVPASECITAYCPIENIHFGEWETLEFTGIVNKNIRYSGVEVSGIKRRDNSKWIQTGNSFETGAIW